MDFDNLIGRALDAAIARVVFGLDVAERTNTRTRESDWVCREPGNEWVRVPFYGLHGASSLTLEAKLAGLGWHVRQSPLLRRLDHTGTALVTLENGDERVDAMGSTCAEALGRAALKVLQKAWTTVDWQFHARSMASGDAKYRAEKLVARFGDCGPEQAEDWGFLGLETAREWLRLIESPSVSQAEVSALLAVTKANQRKSRLWGYLAMYVWGWASHMGYTVPAPHDYRS